MLVFAALRCLLCILNLCEKNVCYYLAGAKVVLSAAEGQQWS
jgi:hypothetical protein